VLQPVVALPGTPSASFGKMILTAITIFILTVILLFTWFGQHWSGLTDLVRAIPNFAARAGGEGHEKPFWYYIVLIGGGWSGAALLALAGGGALITVLDSSRRNFLSVFILAYGIVIAGIYSAIPYKTPWLALNFWLPLALLAGLAVDWSWQQTKSSRARWLLYFCATAICLLMAHDVRQRVFLNPADEKNPYAYAHTVEDLLQLPARLEKLAQQNQQSDPRIAVVAADAWPLPWYLRKFSRVGYWQPGQDPGKADYYITTTDVGDKLAGQLKNYQSEFFGVRPEVLLILWVPPSTKQLP
jgi:predicted membrane-bound mannosyltransferase